MKGFRSLVASRNGASVLLLRAFLGFTFTFAGIQKLADPRFLRPDAPGSFLQQVSASIATSPLHHLLDPALHAPVLVAVLIACGELAVGAGTLAGLLGRVAAAGGMLLSLAFFLSVSFNDSPYYYGADIAFLFAWTPLAIGGSGPMSLDALLARKAGAPSASAMGAVAAPAAAAVAGDLERRALLQRLAAVGAVAGVAATAGGVAAVVGRLIERSPDAQLGRRSAAGGAGSAGGARTVSGTKVIAASALPVGGAVPFTDPAQKTPAWAVQPSRGRFVAFSAICTHAGCTVEFDPQSEQFVCPCHGSIFDARTGNVVQGPAIAPLPRIPLSLGADGELYADA